MQIEIRQTDVFAAWFKGLRDRQARARITVRIRRLSLGNPGDVRPVGEGVSEMRIDYGPWVPGVFHPARRRHHLATLWRRQTHAGTRYQARETSGGRALGGDCGL